MKTVYLLSCADQNSLDDGDVLGVFYTLEDAKRGLTLIYPAGGERKWFDSQEEVGMGAIVSTTLNREDPNFDYVITTARLYEVVP
jgi:hypothetical protein